eukprot:14506598-Alexandrium_andersonii.AAC.1
MSHLSKTPRDLQCNPSPLRAGQHEAWRDLPLRGRGWLGGGGEWGPWLGGGGEGGGDREAGGGG